VDAHNDLTITSCVTFVLQHIAGGVVGQVTYKVTTSYIQTTLALGNVLHNNDEINLNSSSFIGFAMARNKLVG
jgi:hypothetical protein